MTETLRDAGGPKGFVGLWGQWPGWVGYAAAAFSLVYGALGLWWALGGAGFPFGAGHDPLGRGVSILDHARPETAGPAIAALGFAGAAIALVMAGGRARWLPGAALVGFGWAVALGLTVVVPDYRPLLAVVRLPMLLAGAPFGWPREVGLSDFLPLYLPWPVANQVLLMAGGVLWAATAVAFWRGIRGACRYCGRTDAASRWTAPAVALRWGRWAAGVAIAVPLFYALTRWAFFLAIPLGCACPGLRAEEAESPGIWLAGAALATMAAGGAVLTLGLVWRWGEVYPRWIPLLAGKTVRPRTAILPAALVSLLLTTAGTMYVREMASGALGLDWETGPVLAMPLWGVALGAAALSYHYRRRGGCGRCRRS